jgi:hypothetical protein
VTDGPRGEPSNADKAEQRARAARDRARQARERAERERSSAPARATFHEREADLHDGAAAVQESTAKRQRAGEEAHAPHAVRTLTVVDRGETIAFAFADLMRYHGPASPGGVAHAFKVLERALPLLAPEAPPERREITVRTAFGGPGARDAFELVTRAVTEDRYFVDPALARPDRGRACERFVFRLGYRGREVTLMVRKGFVSDEFIGLAREGQRSAEQERRLDVLKREMADHVMAHPAVEVYEVAE